MKFFKLLFSRMALVIIAIALQLLFISGMIITFYTYYPIISTFTTLIALIVLVFLVNRNMSIESKMIWIILLLLVPLFGAIIYLLFARSSPSLKHKKYYKIAIKETKRHIQHDDVENAYLKEVLGEYYGQFEYIRKSTGLVTYNNTKTRYYPTGENFFEDLMIELKKAEKFIFMEYYIIERGLMWNNILEILKEKVKNGVEVMVMYDDIGSITKLPSNYIKRLRLLGIKCVKFNEFKPIVSAFHNNRDHRKITVIDGKVGFVGGMNLADEYINAKQPYGYWKDTAIKLTGDAVRSLTLMFLNLYTVQDRKITDFSKYLLSSYEKLENTGFVAPYGDGPRFFYEDYVAENVYLNIINQSKKYLWITTPYLIIDTKLQTALCLAARRGVDVRIITPRIPDKKIIFDLTRSNYKPLQKAGVKIFEYTKGFIHAKQFLSDGELAILGTINLDYRSLLHHFECGVLMYKTDCIKQIYDDFNHIFTVSEDMEGFKQNVFTRVFCAVAQIFTPLL